MAFVSVLAMSLLLGAAAVLTKSPGDHKMPAWDRLRGMVMFVGYPRTGHTLVGAVLDAHPDVEICNEAHLLDNLANYDSGPSIYEMIHRKSVKDSKDRSWTGYSYNVKGQWQGKTRAPGPLWIGDKQGGHSSDQTFEALTGKLRELVNTTGLPLKLIHVTRNPYDVISAMAMHKTFPPGAYLRLQDRAKKTGALGLVPAATLRKELNGFFGRARTNRQLIEALEKDPNLLGQHTEIYTLSHEVLSEQPKVELSKLCGYLQIECAEDYLNAASGIIWPSKHQTRFSMRWNPVAKKDVKSRLANFAFFDGYTYQTSGANKAWVE